MNKIIFSAIVLFNAGIHAASSSGPSFTLTRTQLSGEHATIFGAASAKAPNKRQHEDRFLVLPGFLGTDEAQVPQAVLVVLDGYQGSYAADEVTASLPAIFEEKMRAGLAALADAQGPMTNDRMVKEALCSAIEDADKTYLQRFIDAHNLAKEKNPDIRLNMTSLFGENDQGYSGATITAAFLSGSRFSIGNLGDCSTFLTRKKYNEDGCIAQRVTPMHRPDDLSEHVRVKAAGAGVARNEWGDAVIVPGAHALTRCLGSMELKPQYAEYFPGRSGAVVSSTPEITSGVQSPNHRALILVSDGITDFIVPKAEIKTIIDTYPLTSEERAKIGAPAPKDVDEDGDEAKEEDGMVLPISTRAQVEIDKAVGNKIAEIVHQVLDQGGTPQDAADELVRFTLENMDGKDDATAVVADLESWYEHAKKLCKEHGIENVDEWETWASEKPAVSEGSSYCSIV